MAKIFPRTLKNYDFKQPGEERVFALLKGLPADVLVWYEVVLGVRSRKPDFLVVDPHRGVFVVEVKDWGESTILGASPTKFKIKAQQGKSTERKNPSRKCKVYIDEVSESLELEPLLVGKYDRLKFPIQYFVVFPNLSEEAFFRMGLDKYLEYEHTIFKKQVGNRKLFHTRLLNSMPLLETPLSPDMLLVIRKRLREENTIDAPGGGLGLLPGVLPEGEIELGETLTPDVFAIDIEQEELAKDMGSGPRLMRGVAGTGKTLIMLMRAKLLASNAESLGKKQRILVLCWNVSLANYMRQAFNSINIPLTANARANIYNLNNVPIVHFMGFARQCINAHPEAGPFPSDSDEDVVTQLLNRVEVQEFEKFDIIIVDEAQDFRDEWLKFLFHKMLKGDTPQEKNFILAADDAQRVYKSRNFTWSGLGIPMSGGRSKILRKIYRNSARVWGFAGFLLGDIREFYDEQPDVKFSPKRGVDPKLLECRSLDEQIQVCIDEIQKIGESGYSWRNVLVIYRQRTYKGFALVERLLAKFDAENIPYDWITRDMGAKKGFRMSRDSVKVSTALSAKGLDAPKVIILNAEAFSLSESAYDERKLMYVAMTRAREELTILYTGNDGMVPELQRCERMYKKYRSRLLELEQEANENVLV